MTSAVTEPLRYLSFRALSDIASIMARRVVYHLAYDLFVLHFIYKKKYILII